MFLNQLSDSSKIAFLNLAHHIARSDNQVTLEEEITIFRYCQEMKIADIDFNEDSFNLINVLKSITEVREQKIFLLEIMGLVYSDEIFQKEEEQIINQIIEHFNVPPSLVVIYSEWAKNALSLVKQGEALIAL